MPPSFPAAWLAAAVSRVNSVDTCSHARLARREGLVVSPFLSPHSFREVYFIRSLVPAKRYKELTSQLFHKDNKMIDLSEMPLELHGQVYC